MILDMTSREMQCPLCQKKFEFRYPTSFSLQDRDTDYCPYYGEANPLFYLVHVCPFCHFAAYRDDFDGADRRDFPALIEALAAAKSRMVDFNQPVRSLFAALQSYQLALACYKARRFAPDIIAGTALRAAWLCRYSGQLGRELQFFDGAIASYRRALEDGLKNDPGIDDLPIAYLIGELSLRSGQMINARHYFQQVIDAKVDKVAIIRQTKDRLVATEQATQVRDFLKGLPIFDQLSTQGLALLAVHTSLRVFPACAAVCTQGEKGESMFVVLKGGVRVFVNDPDRKHPVSVLSAGTAFGEMSLLTGEPRSATVVSGAEGQADPTELLEIGRMAFRNILKLEPDVMAQIAAAVERYKSADEARVKGRQEFQLLDRMIAYLDLERDDEAAPA